MTKRRGNRAGRRKAPIHPWQSAGFNSSNERLFERLFEPLWGRGQVLRSKRAKSEPWRHGIFEVGP